MGDEKIEFIKTNLLKLPTHVQGYETLHRKKKKKSSGYERWYDR